MPDVGITGLESEAISGTDLVRALQAGNLGDLLPKQSAIYLWKLRVKPEVARQNGQGLLEHMDRIASLPQGRLSDIPLGRGLLIQDFLLGGTGLTDKKREELAKLVRTPKGATFVWRYLMFLQTQIPAIYVGETGDLPRRIKEHLDGATDFGGTVIADPDLEWEDLMLEFVRMGEPADDGAPPRRALEYLATLLTISSYTQRPG
jgi:hypothetical protein